MEPINPGSTQTAKEIAGSGLMSPSKNNPEAEKSRDSSEVWLQKVTEINDYLNQQSSIPITRIKIAVLDTGCDREAVFFHSRARRNRTELWKDWVDDSADFEDCDGHGTHTVALVMKMAPTADIFIARVAKDREKLEGASDAVAKAINWAVTQWNVDIVLMSFGFSKEMPDISRAIWQAVLDTNDAILFFAAAGNDGGNRGEMFPANHSLVISIRGTDSQGYFLNFNPPRNRHETVVYGTLGTNVPSAWLRDYPGEMHESGTSVATAIAAGIAAILLGYISGKPPGTVDESSEKRLRSRRGMLATFEMMGKDMGNGCSYLNPCNFFREEDAICLWRIMIAMSELPK